MAARCGSWRRPCKKQTFGKELRMLYNWLYPYAEQFALLNVLKYLTFRSGAAVMTALLISFIIGGPCIRWLKAKQKEGQPIREDGPESHLLTKKGTPTMGGIMIL